MEHNGHGNTVAADPDPVRRHRAASAESGMSAASGVSAASGASAAPAVVGWSKVPVRITAGFWLVKVLTTGMGETTSDFLGGTMSPVLAGAIGLLGLVGALVLQFRATAYAPWTYWSAVVMVSVFGTMAADVVHVIAGVPYAVSAVAFAVLLVAVLVAWRRAEGTLSIHSITTPRRERFYWATVLTTFALGTAVGDLTAGTLRLGYFSSGVLFAVLIAVPALARLAGLDAVATFWWAYILTRPLGASFADWMGVPVHRGGLGWGTGPVSLVLAALIAVAVGCLAARHRTAARRR